MAIHILPQRDINGSVINNSGAFSSSTTSDGKELYLKIHGMSAVVAIGATHVFEFTVPYSEVYVQGAEIVNDVLSSTDMTIRHPSLGVLEQYGYSVVTGEHVYLKESRYAAKIPQGLILSASCENKSGVEQVMGINFILHEIRDPV